MKNLNMLILAILFVSCNNKNNVNEVVTDIKENTSLVAEEGLGKVTLICNGKKIVTEGSSGAIVTMGSLMIALKDKINPAKVFTISFNTDKFPENGKEYIIKSRNYSSDKNPENEITVGFMEVVSKNIMNVWDNDSNSGKIKFMVNGNRITCAFKDLTLQPNTAFNADGLDHVATVSGEITVYKN